MRQVLGIARHKHCICEITEKTGASAKVSAKGATEFVNELAVARVELTENGKYKLLIGRDGG